VNNKPVKTVVKTVSTRKTSVGTKAQSGNRRKKSNNNNNAMDVSTVSVRSQKGNGKPKVVVNKPVATKTVVRTKPVKVTSTPAATPLERATQTARAIVNNPKHPKHSDVKSLLDGYEKSWISESKFIDILKGLLFE